MIVTDASLYRTAPHDPVRACIEAWRKKATDYEAASFKHTGSVAAFVYSAWASALTQAADELEQALRQEGNGGDG